MKHQKVRSIIALLLAVILAFGVAGCGKTETPASVEKTDVAPETKPTEANEAPETQANKPEKKHYVIGVAEAFANDEATIRRMYFENYIAPEYNVDFIFSEVLADDAATKTFIENCIDAGVDAIIDLKSQNETLARLCEENDVVYTINNVINSKPVFTEQDFPMFSTYVGANNDKNVTLYCDWLTANASADGSEGFLLATQLASVGNSQHLLITKGILEALQNIYGLTYEQDIETLAMTSETLTVPNDKNILITLYPGSSNRDVWLPGISALLQSGKYGMLLSAGPSYNATATIVDEVERSFNIDIKVASIASLGTNLETAFNTQDVMGNPSIDLAVIKPVSILDGILFIATYNKLSGAGDATCRTADGKPAQLLFDFFACTSPEQYEIMKDWDDTESQNWIFTYEGVNDLLAIYHPDLTTVDIQNYLAGLDFDSVCDMMSK